MLKLEPRLANVGDASRTATAKAHTAAKQLESLIVKQVLLSSGVFHGTGAAGSSITNDLFAEHLASAITNVGGFGIAKVLERSLQDPTRPPAVAPAPEMPEANLGRLTSGYGTRLDPFTGKAATHTGVDLAAPEGAVIPAAQDGTVVSAGPRGGYGNAVEIAHRDGSTTLYAHASEVLVHSGQHVSAGDTIALVGQTGRSTGPHLHFEVREGGHPVDPSKALKSYRLCAEDSGGDDR